MGPWGCLAVLDLTNNYFSLLIQCHNWDNQTLSLLPSPPPNPTPHFAFLENNKKPKQLYKFMLLSLQSYVKWESLALPSLSFRVYAWFWEVCRHK